MSPKALVIGLGASGRAAAQLLLAEGHDVIGFDSRAEAQPVPGLRACTLGGLTPPDAVYESIDLVLLSPGVPPAPHRAQAARLAPNARITGELDFALGVARRRWPECPTVLITGTNGKSTVTAMLGHVLTETGRRPFVGGNLGVPLSAALLDDAAATPPDALVLECSSYQLETLSDHPVDVAMVLNVSPDHLDRYDDLAHYAATKGRIFRGLRDGGLALTYAPDPRTRIGLPTVARYHQVVVDGPDAPRLHPDGHLEISDGWRVAREAVGLAGRHNAINALFVARAAEQLGVARDACTAALQRFRGLAHRMQYVASHEGIAYYDDSKATNVASVVAMLDGFERPVVLIAGGRAKRGDDLTPIADILRSQGRGLVALGEASDAMMAMAKGVVPTRAVVSMEAAVHAAREMAGPGDAVVLSPACASWDMFDSFAHRGEVFCHSVRAMIGADTGTPSPDTT